MNQPAKMIEALLFVSPQPVNEAELAEAIGCELDEVTAGLEELGAAWAEGERGMVLRMVAGGYTLAYAANGGTGTDPSSSSVSALGPGNVLFNSPTTK